MTIYYQDDHVTLYHGDCLDVLATLPDESVHAVVTDPPYGLEFMGREWDGADGFRRSLNVADAGRDNAFGRMSRTSPEYRAGNTFQQWCEAWARECLRILKPGGHMLAFGGSRTWHRLASAVEDAGFELRDSIAWLYGSGFPKSLDVSKAIDKAAGALAHESVGFTVAGRTDKNLPNPVVKGYTPPVPATPDAERWQGWGTALKPAFEPVVVARKPLVGTVAANVLEFGTGALNIEGCRVRLDGEKPPTGSGNDLGYHGNGSGTGGNVTPPAGRWPANVLLDESQATVLDEQSGTLTSGANPTRRGADKFRDAYGDFRGQEECAPARGADNGGASRFFPTFRYEAKAPASERPRVDGIAHPTVKPLALMQWLVRLVTPPGGVVLEPFAGSGTTLEACVAEGFSCIGIEREADYLPLIVSRLEKPIQIALDFEAS